MGIWYRMGNVPHAQDAAVPPPTNAIQNVNNSTPAPVPAAPIPKYVSWIYTALMFSQTTETSVQRDVINVLTFGCFVLDFYLLLLL